MSGLLVSGLGSVMDEWVDGSVGKWFGECDG